MLWLENTYIQAHFLPALRVKAPGGLVFFLGPAPDVQKGSVGIGHGHYQTENPLPDSALWPFGLLFHNCRLRAQGKVLIVSIMPATIMEGWYFVNNFRQDE